MRHIGNVTKGLEITFQFAVKQEFMTSESAGTVHSTKKHNKHGRVRSATRRRTVALTPQLCDMKERIKEAVIKKYHVSVFLQMGTVPFQLQLSFKTRDQQRVTRIVTVQRPVTSCR